MEGGIDSSHVSFLHGGSLNKTTPSSKGSKGNKYNQNDFQASSLKWSTPMEWPLCGSEKKR
jgi:hypothetical protein